MFTMVATQQDILNEDELIDEITRKLSTLCTLSNTYILEGVEPLTYYQKLKSQLHHICMDIISLKKRSNSFADDLKTNAIIEGMKEKLYHVIHTLNTLAEEETNKQNLFLWKKLCGDYYRNLTVFVPEERDNAQRMYREALELSPKCHNNDLYISLILDYSCLLAENYNKYQQAIKICLELLVDLQSQKTCVMDATSRAYISYIKRNIMLWRKQFIQ
ncbi:hypothetical protein WA158_003775 [Blastocystis sp. Blastoise]